MEEAIKKAHVLIEALPYIKKFHRKIVVIKYGGSILSDAKIRHRVLEDIVFLNFMGLRPLLVHGGGAHISERMRSQGKKARFFEGLRVTDKKTLLMVEEELKKLNKMITEEIIGLGAKAVGLDGKKIIQVQKRQAKIDLGFVGEITRINSRAILKGLSVDTVGVLLPLGRGKDRETYNINADEAAASIATALRAEKLVFLTNVKGIMRSFDEPQSFIPTLNIKEAEGLIKEKIIQEGMIPKVKACIYALENGVKKTHIIDARIAHALLLEIFTDKGIGTEIIR
ncbi:MAG: acetylglutamate kinase [Candidatus Omnitrophica bacterium]|nr:acetylglutamate kinase [Candidatus Omnitrophota bacterium]